LHVDCNPRSVSSTPTGTAKDVTPPSNVPHGRPIEFVNGLHYKALPNTRFVKTPRSHQAASFPSKATRPVSPGPLRSPCVQRVFQCNPEAPLRQPLGNFRFSNFRRALRAANSLKILSLFRIVKEWKRAFLSFPLAPQRFAGEPYNVSAESEGVKASPPSTLHSVLAGPTV
ncbi:MAG TPA: hypothetical protein VGB96_06250, partial [Archangium sp.]